MLNHEEEIKIPQALSWILLVLLTAGVIAWCMLLMMMVGDPPRKWDFGAYPDVPGQSLYSVQRGVPFIDPKSVPAQMPKLPEAKRSRDIVLPGRPQGGTP